MQTTTDTRDLTPPELPPSTSTVSVVAAPVGPYLTADEAADVLRTSRRAVYAMIQRGQLGACVRRVGRRVLIDRAGLLALIEQNPATLPSPSTTTAKPPRRAVAKRPSRVTSSRVKPKAPIAPAPVFLPRPNGGG